jgi:lipopolysaccharide exporter
MRGDSFQLGSSLRLPREAEARVISGATRPIEAGLVVRRFKQIAIFRKARVSMSDKKSGGTIVRKYRSPLALARHVSTLATTPTVAVLGTVALTNIIRIFSSAILTRMLTASDYGVVGIVTSITFIVGMLSDFGFFAFIVRHERGDDPDFLDEVWTVRLLRSFGVTALLIALSMPYASFTGKMILAPVLAVWSFNQALEGLSSLAFAQAVRERKVQRLSWMEFSINLIQVFVTIAFAYYLHSYWAIVVSVLLSGVVKVALSYYLFPNSRRRIRFSRERAREIWKFSRFIAGSSTLTLLLVQTDKVILSRVMPLALFGLYSLAVLLALAPRAAVTPYCTRILYPAYAARFREAGIVDFASVFYGRRRVVCFFFIFSFGGIKGAAPQIVSILYDPRYTAVAPLLRIVAISTMLVINNGATEQALIAIGKTQVQFHINLARVTWLAIAGSAGFALAGPIGLIWAVGTIEVPAMLWSWFSLAGIRALRMREELLALAIAGFGVAHGVAASEIIFWLL